MTFYAIQIEECPGFGWQGGPEFDTLIRALEDSGRNQRTARRSVVIHRYVCPFNNISLQQYLNIKKVFMAVWGSFHTFLHHDHLDDSATDEPFGTGNGTTSIFQLSKTYDPGGGATYTRTITKPDLTGVLGGGALVVKANGIEVFPSVSATTGAVDFGSDPPAPGVALTWTGRHYICVRFNRDDLPFTIDNKSATAYITNGALELVEELKE